MNITNIWAVATVCQTLSNSFININSLNPIPTSWSRRYCYCLWLMDGETVVQRGGDISQVTVRLTPKAVPQGHAHRCSTWLFLLTHHIPLPALYPPVRARPLFRVRHLSSVHLFHRHALATVLCVFVSCHVPHFLGLPSFPLHPTHMPLNITSVMAMPLIVTLHPWPWALDRTHADILSLELSENLLTNDQR